MRQLELHYDLPGGEHQCWTFTNNCGFSAISEGWRRVSDPRSGVRSAWVIERDDERDDLGWRFVAKLGEIAG